MLRADGVITVRLLFCPLVCVVCSAYLNGADVLWLIPINYLHVKYIQLVDGAIGAIPRRVLVERRGHSAHSDSAFI